VTACLLPRWLGPRLIVIACALLALTVHVGVAYADGGEAGLVIQHGDGSVDTYCVGFQGGSLSGSDILAKAGIPVVQFSGAVCAIGTREGCFQPSSFETCYCMSYPPTSTYWAFYTEPHGKQWQYSALGYQDPRSALRDGDMQAWRWGKGGPNSAPLPVALSFEQVCGHSPQGGAQLQTVTQPPSTPPPTPSQTDATTAPTAPLPDTPAAARGSAPASSASADSTGSPTVEIRSHGTATVVPQPPVTGANSDGGSNATSVIAFAAVAVALLATIGGALVWRRRHGV
jgi:hypothetical protein